MGFFLGQNEADVRRVAHARSFDVTCEPIQSGVEKFNAQLHLGAESERSGASVFLFSLLDGKLYLIQYGFPADDYTGIETALLQKYGDPTRIIMKEAHHGLDTIPQKNSVWVGVFDMLLLTEGNPDGGTFSTVKLVNSPSFQEAAARGAGDGPNI
jgi:hypothetical protein